MNANHYRPAVPAIGLFLFLAFFAAAADPIAPAKPPGNPSPAAPAPANSAGSTGGGIGGFFKSVKEAVGIGAPEPVRLLNGKRLDTDFYTWIKKSGVYVDSDKVFSVKDGELRISGKREGYLATKSQFSDFRLVAEYRWGDNKWPPREDKPRNSGIIVAATGEDKEWMKGIECQIAEGSTGEIVLHGGAQMTAGRETKSKAWAVFPRAATNEVEHAHGKWNTLEIVVEGGHVRARVNGQVTMEGFGASPNSGKILLQSNGAEIFFRKLDIYPLNSGSVTGPGGK